MPGPAAEPASRAARAVRGGTASGLGVLVALAAHLAGGGSAPPVVLLVAATVLVQPFAVLLAGRTPRLWRQAALTGLGQLAMHAVFALGAAPAGIHPIDPMAGMHGPAALPLTAAPAAAHDMPTMWWAHAAAWLLTTAGWRWGEATLRRLLSSLHRVVRRTAPLPLPTVPGVAVRLFGALDGAPAHTPVLLAADPRRGPPLLG